MEIASGATDRRRVRDNDWLPRGLGNDGAGTQKGPGFRSAGRVVGYGMVTGQWNVGLTPLTSVQVIRPWIVGPTGVLALM